MEQEVKQFRNSKEWKEKREKLIQEKKKCEWCLGKEHLTPAHKHEEFNIRKMKYIDWYRNFDNCLLLCRRCHFAQGKGMILCRICKKKYHKWGWDTCWDCNPKKEEIEIRKIKEEIEGLEYQKGSDGISFYYHDSPYECYICGNDGEYESIGDDYEQYCFCKKCSKLPNREEVAYKKYEDIVEKRNKEIKNKIKELKQKIEDERTKTYKTN